MLGRVGTSSGTMRSAPFRCVTCVSIGLAETALTNLSVKLHLRHKRTSRQTDKETIPIVRFSLCRLCLSGVSILWVDEARCFIEI